MIQSTITRKLKAFDVYKTMPKDLTEPTVSGAISNISSKKVSIISTVIMITLFITETMAFMSPLIISEMTVDHGQGVEKIGINIDLTLHRLPCEILSLDIMDIMGNHEIHLGGRIVRNRIDKIGRLIGVHDNTETDHDPNSHQYHGHQRANDKQLESAKKAMQAGEGCNLAGAFDVNRVPGNFHISSHAFGNVIGRLFQETEFKTIDVSHTINHLSFGHYEDMSYLTSKFHEALRSPLDGTHKEVNPYLAGAGSMHQYYLNVVDTKYHEITGEVHETNQYTYNYNGFSSNVLPAVFFRFDLSPVVVSYYEKKNNFFHFIVQLCAIIGGVYTVAGIIDAMVHKSLLILLKKASIGKLS